ncbi:YeeE/YedE family protein [Proteus terrae]|uniref:YeeE/YedE family protein n=1 Tax=Proteus terrae TaxID=1574161 RepID=UPI0021BB76B4|nr:YeeE/YedE family protein [Proteus terrae]MCT8263576.1 YeeE/YedE family protein [Proteus terrae]
MTKFVAFLCGLLFSAGLIVGGMSNPQKILGFLDITGNWDPSLLIIMGAGLLVSVIGYQLTRRRQQSVLACPLNIPTNKVIDKPLVLGSVLFGLGWGLAGICPGPSLVLAGAGFYQGILFVLAMIVGWLLVGLFRKTQ